jgi:K+-transporting ATPase ATPase C chain
LALFVLSEGRKLAVNGALGLVHVIPTSRLSSGYLAGLSAGSLRSALELDRKWATRFGRPIFPDLEMPLPGLILRTVATFVLRLWSPRYAVKHAAFRTLLVFTVLCGLIYPAAMVGVSQLFFHNQANGSMVSFNGHVVGSSLLCQEFADAKGNPLPQYFQPRPSDAVDATSKTDYGCNPLFSAASNLGPNNPDLVKLIEQRRQDVAKLEGVDPSQVPPDAVTASGSGLDPAISPAYAALQVNRVARERGLSVDQVKQLVKENTKGRTLGFLGEPAVNVVTLNNALAALG